MAKTDVRASNECWPWVGTFSGNGYGTFSYRGKQYIAHRAVFKEENGDIPGDIYVCHKCDNKWCVNPSHLFAGTPNDNMQDKVSKGRQSRGAKHSDSFRNSKKYRDSIRRGENHPMSKLSDAQRIEILAMIDDGVPQSAIAEKFGVWQPTISNVKRNYIPPAQAEK